MTRIAVIGGGAAGAAVVGEYLRGPRRADLSLAWIAGHGAPGRGVAYSATSDFHLLNVRAAGMGLFADDVCGFLDHLNANGRRVSGGDFVPRAWFGDFVEATLARLLADARGGAHVEVMSTEAIRVLPTPAGRYAVALRDGRHEIADELVLALGGLPPDPVDGVGADALNSGAYVLDPWAQSRRRPAPARIVVIGSGLTAVDAALEAASRWPSARIAMLSRHGRLPSVHPHQPPRRTRSRPLSTTHCWRRRTSAPGCARFAKRWRKASAASMRARSWTACVPRRRRSGARSEPTSAGASCATCAACGRSRATACRRARPRRSRRWSTAAG